VLRCTLYRLKKVFHRTRHYFQARFAYVVALFNAVLGLNRRPDAGAAPQERCIISRSSPCTGALLVT
jgi:hypothetical protein